MRVRGFSTFSVLNEIEESICSFNLGRVDKCIVRSAMRVDNEHKLEASEISLASSGCWMLHMKYIRILNLLRNFGAT